MCIEPTFSITYSIFYQMNIFSPKKINFEG